MHNGERNHRSFFSHLLTSMSLCELCLEMPPQHLFLCQHCASDLPMNLNACSQCSEPLAAASPGSVVPALESKRRCGRCQHSPPHFDYSHCQFLYRPPVSNWIQRMKDKRQLIWTKRLAYLMWQSPPAALSRVDALTFIPSSRSRHLLRGFNPGELMARELSRHSGIPLLPQALHKLRAKDQRGLTAHQRYLNLRNTLRPLGRSLNNQHILIVDDVMTTGATLDIAARGLKAQGASIVGAWVLARTPPKR